MALKKFNAVSGFSVGNDVIFDVIDDAANVTANNLTVTAISNFGDVGNVKITGGSSGQYLQTDGTGNLFWTTGTGGGGTGTPGGVTTEVQFNDGGSFAGVTNFTFNKSSNVLNVTGSITRDNKNVPTYAASLTAPANPKMGDLWYDTNNDIIYQYIFDGTSSAWVDTTSGFISAAITPSAGFLVQRDAQGNIYSNGISGTTLTLTGNATASYYLGDGGYLTNLNGANVSGNVSHASHAYYSDIANSVAGANVSGNVSQAVHSYYSDVANSVAGANVSGNVSQSEHSYYSDVANSIAGANVSGNVSQAAHAWYADVANLVTGANVSGQVSNALIAGTVYTNAQPNITSVGTLTSVEVTGNAKAGNILTDNILYANGSPYTFTTSAAGSNTQVQFNNNNLFGTSANFTFDTAYQSGAGLLTVKNLNVTSVANVGSIGNLKISGGYAGYVMSTDGSGNLSWVDMGAGSGSGFVSINKNSFTGDGSTKDFTLSTTPVSAQSIVVNINGLVQLSSSYSLDGAILSFASAPLNGEKLEITVYGSVNMTGTNTQILFNDGGQFGATSAFTFDKTSNVLSVGGNVSATYFVGNGAFLTGLPASYANSNVAAYLPTYTGLVGGTLTTAAQPNITSVGTLTSLTATGNITGNYIIGNGSQLTGLPAGYANSNVAAYLPTYTGNISAGNVSVTGTLTAGAITTSGTGGNISGVNYVTSNYFVGNGSTLTHITGANVDGYVPLATTANIAGTVTTNAQPNITSVGNLTDLSVTGNAFVGGNLIIQGVTTYENVDTFTVQDPIVEFGAGANNAALVANDNKDRGTLLHYYTTTPVDAFMGWDNSNGEFGFGSNVTVTNEIVTWNTYGNVRAGYFIGNGSSLTGMYSNTNANAAIDVRVNKSFVDSLGIAATTAGTVTTNAQPNVTSVGTLTSLTVSGTTATSSLKLDNLLSNRANVSVTTNTVIDEFAPSSYRSAKYVISASGTNGYQTAEVVLVHDGASSYISVYGSICSNNIADIVEFSSNINGVSGNVAVYATASGASTKVNLTATYLLT